MSLKKPQHPLNAAVISIGVIFSWFALMSVLTAVLWHFAVDCAAFTVTLFFAGTLLLAGYALYALKLNSASQVRDRLKALSFLAFLPAILLIAALELWSGYVVSKAHFQRKRLNDYYYGELDDDKLCARLMAGEDPEKEPFKSGSADEIMKSGKVPEFRGVYSGDFATSFGDGGKVYLRMGRELLDRMKEAGEKRNSEEFADCAEKFAKVLNRASGCLRDPENAAVRLGTQFVQVFQEHVTIHFPATSELDRCVAALSWMKENFEPNTLSFITYDTQSVLTGFDKLLDDNSRVGKMVTSDLTPVWSDMDILAGRLFFSARRNRIVNDYSKCMELLNIYRGIASTFTTSVNRKVNAVTNRFDKLSKERRTIVLLYVPDIREQVRSIGKVQHLIENAALAGEIELHRRKNKTLPAKLEEFQTGRIMAFPNSHIDDSKYELVKGRFKDKSGKEYSGYALKDKTGIFVITDRK